MTQKNIIKQMLETNNWICGTEFLKNFIPEFRSRVNELRKEGLVIETRICQTHNHRGNLQEWRLEPRKIEMVVQPIMQEKLFNFRSMLVDN